MDGGDFLDFLFVSRLAGVCRMVDLFFMRIFFMGAVGVCWRSACDETVDFEEHGDLWFVRWRVDRSRVVDKYWYLRGDLA